MSATIVGTLVALALLVAVVVLAAEWSLRHRRRRRATSAYPPDRIPTPRSSTSPDRGGDRTVH